MLKSEIPQNPWSINHEEILNILGSSPQGLSFASAKSRLDKFGLNIIPEKKPLTKLSIFLNQLKSPLIFILIIAVLITLALQEIRDALIIGAAVLVNSFLGF